MTPPGHESVYTALSNIPDPDIACSMPISPHTLLQLELAAVFNKLLRQGESFRILADGRIMCLGKNSHQTSHYIEQESTLYRHGFLYHNKFDHT